MKAPAGPVLTRICVGCNTCHSGPQCPPIELAALSDHFEKLLRFRGLKQQLAALRAEHDRLQQELFGAPPEVRF